MSEGLRRRFGRVLKLGIVAEWSRARAERLLLASSGSSGPSIIAGAMRFALAAMRRFRDGPGRPNRTEKAAMAVSLVRSWRPSLSCVQSRQT
jgi:hypothetical protein